MRSAELYSTTLVEDLQLQQQCNIRESFAKNSQKFFLLDSWKIIYLERNLRKITIKSSLSGYFI